MDMRVFRARAAVWLAGVFLLCLACQAYPATVHAHHDGSSTADRGCAAVMDASPVSAGHPLIESLRNAEQSHVQIALWPSSSAVVGWVEPHARSAIQPTVSAPPNSRALYQLNRVYRL